MHTEAALNPTEPVKDELELPPEPTALGALSAGLSGFYFNSWKVVPANVVWGAALFAIVGIFFTAPLIGLLLFLLVLPFPTAGMFRLAVLIQRGEPSHLSDAFAWRAFGRKALVVGLAVGAFSVVCVVNVLIGLGSGDIIGVAFATVAFWSMVIVWLIAAALWPLIVDPLRQEEPVMNLVRLALVVALIRMWRYLALMAVLAVVLILSAILFVTLITVSMAYFTLVMAAYSIPIADRIEGRRTYVVTA